MASDSGQADAEVVGFYATGYGPKHETEGSVTVSSVTDVKDSQRDPAEPVTTQSGRAQG